MLKKIFFIILLLNLLNHCEYKPVYSNQNKVNYKIIVTSFSGDKEINNLITSTIKRNNNESSNKTLNISFDTKYTKNILAKNAAGTITDYQANVITKFNFKKMTDKYEEKNYERTIKKNLADSISQKLILRLTVN